MIYSVKFLVLLYVYSVSTIGTRLVVEWEKEKETTMKWHRDTLCTNYNWWWWEIHNGKTITLGNLNLWNVMIKFVIDLKLWMLQAVYKLKIICVSTNEWHSWNSWIQCIVILAWAHHNVAWIGPSSRQFNSVDTAVVCTLVWGTYWNFFHSQRKLDAYMYFTEVCYFNFVFSSVLRHFMAINFILCSFLKHLHSYFSIENTVSI